MNYYFKTYDIEHLDFEQISQTVNDRYQKTTSAKHIINLEGGNEYEKKFGLACEEIVFELDNEVIASEELYSKYDYIKGERYIDLKGIRTQATLSKIIEYNYTVCILAEQVWKAQAYCDDNSIAYHDFCYEIAWWNGTDGKFIRAFNDNLRLDKILSTEPFQGHPTNTIEDTENNPWQYKVKMSADKEGEENIIL